MLLDIAGSGLNKNKFLIGIFSLFLESKGIKFLHDKMKATYLSISTMEDTMTWSMSP